MDFSNAMISMSGRSGGQVVFPCTDVKIKCKEDGIAVV